jgi:hypothetical protein
VQEEEGSGALLPAGHARPRHSTRRQPPGVPGREEGGRGGGNSHSPVGRVGRLRGWSL